MKKFLSVILCLMLTAGVVLFAACKKEDDYNLDNLYLDYLSIANNCQHVKIENDILRFDYAQNGHDYFADAVAYEPYCHINDYNTLLYNILDFVSVNIKRCSTNGIEVDNKTKLDLKTKLNELSEKFEVLEIQISTLSTMLESVKADNVLLQNSVYLDSLKYFLSTYDDMFIKAYNFSFALSHIYFNYAVTSSNPEFSANEDFTNNDALKVLPLLNSRLLIQRANESYKYIVTTLQNSNFLDSITTSGAMCGDMPGFNNYLSQIESVTAADFYPADTANRLGSEQLNQFKFIAIELYNIQACQANDYEKYNKAKSEINYAAVKANNNASNYEKLCASVMDEYFNLCNKNAVALNKLLVLIGVK